MRSAAGALFVLLLAAGMTVAQMAPSNSQAVNPAAGSQPAAGATVTAGTEIKATLDTPLSSKTSQVGDRFTATVQQPVPADNGGTAIPSGSHLNGEVSEPQSGRNLTQARGGGRLNLRFREVVLPNGTSVPLSATLISIRDTRRPDPGVPNAEGQVPSATSDAPAARAAGVDARTRSITGLAFGPARKGLAIAGAAGGGYVLAGRAKDVNLPASSGLVLRLDQPLTVPSSATPGK